MQTHDKSQIINAARGILKAHGYFVDNLWHTDDIRFISEQQELGSISEEDALAVFDIANEYFDGENGISWPQLERALRIYLQRREALHRVYQRSSSGHLSPAAV